MKYEFKKIIFLWQLNWMEERFQVKLLRKDIELDLGEIKKC